MPEAQHSTAQHSTAQHLDNLSIKLTQLKLLLPEIFCEEQIDFQKFQQLFSDHITSEPERYMLNWAGKSEAYRILQAQTCKTLTPQPAESVNFDSTENIFIEGENLDVLKVLQKSYFNSIKMIYIDPPYNTGNDFVYNDNFKQDLKNYQEQSGELDEEGKLKLAFKKNSKENGHFHSKWLNMMLPRLHLAKNLLKDDGVIFISIDDNEQAQLKLLCDEVFGEENFVAILSTENNPKGRKNSKYISISNDFCIIYAKNKEHSCFIENIPKNEKDMKLDENGNYVHSSGKRVLVGENEFNELVSDFNSDKHYSVYFNKDDNDFIISVESSITDKDEKLIKNGYIRYISFSGRDFVENTYTKSKIINLYENDALEFSDDKIYEKNFSDTIRMKSILNNKSYKAISNGNLIDYKLDLKTTSAGSMLKELFNTSIPVFSAPKNVNFLKHLVTLFEDRNFVALDFFAGSSSFPHAVLESNYSDGGKRKFIAVQYPEEIDITNKNGKSADNFCKVNNLKPYITEISKERIRRAGKQIAENYPDKQMDIGFKVFKLTDSHFKQWQSPSAENLAQQIELFVDPVRKEATPDAMLYEILLRLGLKLTAKVRSKNQVFWVSDESGQQFALLLETLSADLLDQVISAQPKKVVTLDSLFNGDDALKKNAELQMNDAGIAFFVL